MIRKLSSGKYRLYSRKKDKKSGNRKNLGTFKTRAGAIRHERAVQFFKTSWLSAVCKQASEGAKQALKDG
jgi:hypothetical protein